MVGRRPGSVLREEYENSLQGRDFLEQALSALSPEAREHVMEIVAQLDERFLTTTREVPDSVQRPQPWRAQGWWWFRAPARMGGLAR